MINIDARVSLVGDEFSGSGAITGNGQSVTISTVGMAMVAVQLNGTLTAGAIRLLTTLVAQDTGLSPFFLDSYEHGDFYSVDTVSFYSGIIMYIPCAGLDSIQIVSQSGFTGSLTIYWKATSLTNMVKVLGQVRVIPQVGGDPFPIVASGGLNVQSTIITTDTPLLAGASYISPVEDVLQYASITLSIFSDVETGPLGIFVYWYDAAGTYLCTDSRSYGNGPYASGRSYELNRKGARVQVEIFNGVIPQTEFHVRCILNVVSTGTDGGSIRGADTATGTDPVSDRDTITVPISAQESERGWSLFCQQMTWNPVLGLEPGGFGERVRSVLVFRTVAATAAGNTVLWTPATARKFRLMRYCIEISGNAIQAVAGIITISLFDGAAGVTNQVHSVFVPAIPLNAQGSLYTSPWIDLGNGYVSVLEDNILNVNLSAALTGGVCRVIACGANDQAQSTSS